jgi:lipopolysaccharide-induced tumor necrosis factor-alpha factor
MAQPVFVGASMIRGNNPVQCTCPQCGKQIVTQITKKTGILTWLICAGIAFFGGIFGCCLIPFCIDACKVSIIFN